MPDSSAHDANPAWIKGDLPQERQRQPPPVTEETPTGAAAGTETPEASVDAGAAGLSVDGAERPWPEGQTDTTPAGDARLDSEVAPQAAPAQAVEAAAAVEAAPAEPVQPPTAPAKGKRRARQGNATATSLAAGHRLEWAPGQALDAAAASGFRPIGPEATGSAVSLGLEALLESLLFVADGAVPVARLAEALEVTPREVEAALITLSESYRQRGLSLQRFRDKVQLTTSPSAAGKVERFLGLAAATPLSRAALETLAIIAYQQPVTRPQIDAVRGVNSDSVIKTLLSKGLVEESGRAEGPGRPVLYSTTSEFMQHFGLASLGDLPPLSLPEANSPPASAETILKG